MPRGTLFIFKYFDFSACSFRKQRSFSDALAICFFSINVVYQKASFGDQIKKDDFFDLSLCFFAIFFPNFMKSIFSHFSFDFHFSISFVFRDSFLLPVSVTDRERQSRARRIGGSSGPTPSRTPPDRWRLCEPISGT